MKSRKGNPSLLNDIEPERAQTTDPLADLFKGIQFRDGGKEEAIRRVHALLAEKSSLAYQHAQADHAQELKRKDVKLRQHREKIERLENAIHDIQRDHGKHLVHAITRQVYAYDGGEDAAQEESKAVRS